MYYPKIDTLLERGEDFKVTNIYRREEFGYIDEWLWMEKIDGANISLKVTQSGHAEWRGRTKRSNFNNNMTQHLDEALETYRGLLHNVALENKVDVELFGEIYGPKIQNGGIYRKDIGTTFYDVRVTSNGKSLWLGHDNFIEIAEAIDCNVPVHGFATTEELVGIVEKGFNTFETGGSGGPAEGIIAKTFEPLYMNNGERLMWKIKHKDFA